MRASPTRGMRRHRSGVGLAELLIGLAIAAALLTAVAAAVDGSFKAYAINQEQTSLIQQARLALHQMTASIRTAETHSPAESDLVAEFVAGQTVRGTSIGLINAEGADVVYRYEPATQRVLAVVDGTPHVLARGVEAFSISMEPMRSARAIKTGRGCDLLRRATVVLTVHTTDETSSRSETTSRQTITLSAAVAPRQNNW